MIGIWMFEKQNSRRGEYERLVAELKATAAAMRSAGEGAESIARALHAERRALAAQYKELTPEPLRTRLYERTLRIYGDPIGPTIEFLRSNGRSWDQIIESAARPGILDVRL
jgi:hypothetical protein